MIRPVPSGVSRQASLAGKAAPSAVQRAPDNKNALYVAGMMWVLLLYMIVPGDLLDPDFGKLGAAGGMAEPNPIARTLKLVLLVLSTVVVLRRPGMASLLIRTLNPFFLVFLALVPLSVLWSIDPSSTLARFVSLLSVVMVCFAFGVASWHRLRFQNVLRPVLTCVLLASLIFGYLAPDLAIHQIKGALNGSWHGITSQKNILGQVASFGVIFWLHAWLAKEVKLLPALFGGGIGAACLLLSRSSTSIIATVFAAVFLTMLLRSVPALRRYTPYFVTIFAAIVLTYAVAVLKLVPGLELLLTPITSLTGKDMTFSNRSEIWDIIKEHVQLSPYVGSGYGAYWVGPIPSSPSYVFLSRMYFYPTESHNGYLEVVNDLGFVGLMCLLSYLIVYVRQSLQLMRVDRSQGALFLGLFFHQAINNLSESFWWSINAPSTFIIMTTATIFLGRALLESRPGLRLGRPPPVLSRR